MSLCYDYLSDIVLLVHLTVLVTNSFYCMCELSSWICCAGAAEIVRAISLAVAHLHNMHIAHRDLKVQPYAGLHTEGVGALGFPPSSLSFPPPPRIWSESNVEYKKFSGGACHQTP